MNEHLSIFSLLSYLDWPGGIVIIIIVFSANLKLLAQKSQGGVPFTLSIEDVDKGFRN